MTLSSKLKAISSRLPGKVLKRIGTKTILEIMYNRLSFSKINKIFAIPDNKKIKLLNFIKLKNIIFLRDLKKMYYKDI